MWGTRRRRVGMEDAETGNQDTSFTGIATSQRIESVAGGDT